MRAKTQKARTWPWLYGLGQRPNSDLDCSGLGMAAMAVDGVGLDRLRRLVSKFGSLKDVND